MKPNKTGMQMKSAHTGLRHNHQNLNINLPSQFVQGIPQTYFDLKEDPPSLPETGKNNNQV